MNLEALAARTLPELKTICRFIGVQKGGRKDQIVNSIEKSLNSKSPFEKIPNNGRNLSILSIDMGIKNFSYARLQLDKTLPFNRPPLITEWNKLDVNQYADNSNDGLYSPIRFAKVAHRIVEEVILSKQMIVPDVILIERQRIRSGGSKNVVEWIFKVNMFESMIHALLYSKKASGKLLSGTTIVSTDPKRMADYWTPPLEKADGKKYRLNFVENQLRSYSHESQNGFFSLPSGSLPKENNGLETKKTSLSRTKWIYETVKGLPGLNGQNTEGLKEAQDAKKGDDLVDSLLHGLSFYEWEKNKMIFKLELSSSVEDALKFVNNSVKKHNDLLFSLVGDDLKKNSKPSSEKKRSSKKQKKISGDPESVVAKGDRNLD